MEKKNITHHDADWGGYTLDDLRYQRAVTLARMEVEKEKLMLGVDEVKSGMPGAGGSGIMGKIVGSLSYIDYIVLAFRLTRSLSRAFKRK